jgi:hypothetical protein
VDVFCTTPQMLASEASKLQSKWSRSLEDARLIPGAPETLWLSHRFHLRQLSLRPSSKSVLLAFMLPYELPGPLPISSELKPLYS